MKIVSEMANYSLGEADELRRAIGKKNPELMKKNREKFVTNAEKTEFYRKRQMKFMIWLKNLVDMDLISHIRRLMP